MRTNPHQPHLDGVAQGDAGGVEVDLHPARLAGLGKVLCVREGGSHDEQAVAALHGLCGGSRAEDADGAGGKGMVVGDGGLAQERLGDGGLQALGRLDEEVGCTERTAAGEDGDALAGVQHLGGAGEVPLGRETPGCGGAARRVVPDVVPGERVLPGFLLLEVRGEGDVRNAAVGEGVAAGEVRDLLDVGGAHHPGVVTATSAKTDGGHVLLAVGIHQVVVLVPGDGEDGLAVHLGVVQAVQEVEGAGARGRQAHAEFPGELGIAAGHERGGLLVAHLDEADPVLARAQRLHDPVDPVPR